MSNLSYREALAGVLDRDDIEGLVGVIDQHKGWGATMCRFRSHIPVLLVDEIKRLREMVGGYENKPVEVLPTSLDD